MRENKLIHYFWVKKSLPKLNVVVVIVVVFTVVVVVITVVVVIVLVGVVVVVVVVVVCIIVGDIDESYTSDIFSVAGTNSIKLLFE